MKKFIAAFDGLSFSESTMSYAIFFAKHCNAHLVGVFLDDFMRRSYGVSELVHYEGLIDKSIHELDEQDKETRQQSVEIFQQACQNAGLNYSIHKDKDVAIQELLHESIYADLLIINANETLTRFGEDVPPRFIRDLLNEVQCPVVITPLKFKPVNKIIMLYDGSPSSVLAVKMFSYLFDSLMHFDIEVLTVKSIDDSMHLPDNKLVREFMKRHYPKAEYTILKGSAEDEIIKHIQHQKQESLVVLGAYQRSKFSRLFKPSMADSLLQYPNKLPLFVAHNKS